MATIMEKDVLIEYVSYATALIARKTNDEHPKKLEMWNLKKYLYNTNYNDIDFEKVVSVTKPIIESLKDLPEYKADGHE